MMSTASLTVRCRPPRGWWESCWRCWDAARAERQKRELNSADLFTGTVDSGLEICGWRQDLFPPTCGSVMRNGMHDFSSPLLLITRTTCPGSWFAETYLSWGASFGTARIVWIDEARLTIFPSEGGLGTIESLKKSNQGMIPRWLTLGSWFGWSSWGKTPWFAIRLHLKEDCRRFIMSNSPILLISGHAIFSLPFVAPKACILSALFRWLHDLLRLSAYSERKRAPGEMHIKIRSKICVYAEKDIPRRLLLQPLKRWFFLSMLLPIGNSPGCGPRNDWVMHEMGANAKGKIIEYLKAPFDIPADLKSYQAADGDVEFEASAMCSC